MDRWITLLTRFDVNTMKNERFKHLFEKHKVDRVQGKRKTTKTSTISEQYLQNLNATDDYLYHH